MAILSRHIQHTHNPPLFRICATMIVAEIWLATNFATTKMKFYSIRLTHTCTPFQMHLQQFYKLVNFINNFSGTISAILCKCYIVNCAPCDTVAAINLKCWLVVLSVIDLSICLMARCKIAVSLLKHKQINQVLFCIFVWMAIEVHLIMFWFF